ncbi:hypothetical protein [Mucilaginibacter auburnensis]|uniref:Lipoprotein n=1 Tax=Mucilaginibacter auburnensis TaxID=1457233 RepID=A0A2H9VP56_9SPHI|nr:hypothetical protein [Mucilaginibacter auburnensis]PJJ80124.1 hypothetical protein CLV57_3269 [Mucilaginibacter auburnensis]
MKKLILNTLAVALLLTTACKKDNNNNEIATGGAATVTASNYGFDGSASLGKFSSTKAGITQVSINGVTTFNVTAIRDGGNESITLVLLKKAAVGKIQFGSQLANGGIIISKDYTKAGDGALNYSTDNNGTTMSGGGEVNFTKVDGNNVEGTFYAVAYNNAKKEAFVEQGSFKGTIK